MYEEINKVMSHTHCIFGTEGGEGKAWDPRLSNIHFVHYMYVCVLTISM